MNAKLLVVAAVLAAASGAMAKLPAPVLDDAAKAKAEEAKAKTAHTGKVDAYKLCLSMERAAANHFKAVVAMGKQARPPHATPPCADPGPFVWPLPAAPAVAAPAAPKS